MNNDKIVTLFQHYFPGNAEGIRLFFAPGRVNLIGEHTDYNGGYVFPAALTIGTYMAVRERADQEFHLRSANFKGDIHFSLQSLHYDREDDWGNYPKGVIRELLCYSQTIKGADIFYYGNLPNGAGLSSSASIGMVTAFGLASMNDIDLSMKELAYLCKRMENHFIGVNSGLMDQVAVGFGKKDHAVFMNCKTTEIEQVLLQLPGYKLVITNTNKRRDLADSKYNERCKECEEGLKAIQSFFPDKEVLGDLTLAEFEKVESAIFDSVVCRRIRHVVSENNRVLQTVKALERGDLLAVGREMIASHVSLRDDYEVTGKELDALFEIQNSIDGCIGSRMTGAGFGGCTVSIVKEEEIEKFKKFVTERYEQMIGLTPSFYSSDIGDGVREWKGE